MASITYEEVWKTFDDTTAVQEFSLEITDGEFVVLVGPSGCGKTTALRCSPGSRGDRGSDPDRRPGRQQRGAAGPRHRHGLPVLRALPAHEGLRQPRVRPEHESAEEEIDERVRRAAKILQLTPLLKRKPKQLSGGQRQRVALGRAIVREPVAFLMDEPLSNLDAQLRVETLSEILKLQRRLGTTTIYVTHDQVEAMTMGDRIAVMRDGLLQQVGPAAELYERPANVFVAGFIGSPAMNLVPGPVVGAGGQGVVVGFRPEHMALGNGQADGLRFDATVDVVEYLGNENLVHLVRDEAQLIALLPVEARVSEGESIALSVPNEKVYRFDAASEQALPR